MRQIASFGKNFRDIATLPLRLAFDEGQKIRIGDRFAHQCKRFDAHAVLGIFIAQYRLEDAAWQPGVAARDQRAGGKTGEW